MIRITIKNLECPHCKCDEHELINWEIKLDTTFIRYNCKKPFKLVICTAPIYSEPSDATNKF